MATRDGSEAPGLIVETPSGSKGRFVVHGGAEAGFGGGVAAVSYMNRARDSGAPAGPAVYVTWVTLNNTTDAYPGSPPYGGPLVDRVFWVLD